MEPVFALLLIGLAIILLLPKETAPQFIKHEITQAQDDNAEPMTSGEPVSDATLLELWEVTGNPIYYEMLFGQEPPPPGQMPTVR